MNRSKCTSNITTSTAQKLRLCQHHTRFVSLFVAALQTWRTKSSELFYLCYDFHDVNWNFKCTHICCVERKESNKLQLVHMWVRVRKFKRNVNGSRTNPTTTLCSSTNWNSIWIECGPQTAESTKNSHFIPDCTILEFITEFVPSGVILNARLQFRIHLKLVRSFPNANRNNRKENTRKWHFSEIRRFG